MKLTSRLAPNSAHLAAVIATVGFAAGSLSHAPVSTAETKAPDQKPAEVTCPGGGKPGDVIDVEVTATLPNGQKGKSKLQARCEADGRWKILQRSAPMKLRPGLLDTRPSATGTATASVRP
jgi:hypothetical protein